MSAPTTLLLKVCEMFLDLQWCESGLLINSLKLLYCVVMLHDFTVLLSQNKIEWNSFIVIVQRNLISLCTHSNTVHIQTVHKFAKYNSRQTTVLSI